MEMTTYGLVVALHGMLFGGFFLMAIFGLLVELHRSAHEADSSSLTSRGQSLRRIYLTVLVVLGWAAVLSGAYMVYPWYRAIPTAGTVDLAAYPQRLLMSSSRTYGWHSLGMEWKEHAAWLAPIAMTMAAYVLLKYRGGTKEHAEIRSVILKFSVVAFLAAGVAGVFGAMINKQAPVQGGSVIHLERIEQ